MSSLLVRGAHAEDVVAQVETAYRGALVEGCPAAVDHALFAQAVTQAAAYWVCAMLARCQRFALAKGEW